MRMAEVLVFTTPPAFAVILAALVVRLHGHLIEVRDYVTGAERTDPATGLLNGRAFEELLEIELARARAAERPLSVVVGRVDGLTTVGGACNPALAGPALRGLGRDLVKWKRRTDHAARIADDVIALVLPNTDEGGALILAERLRRATELSFGDLPARLSTSFGVASQPWHGTEARSLREAAESAMVAARARGGQRVLLYGPEVARVQPLTAASV